MSTLLRGESWEDCYKASSPTLPLGRRPCLQLVSGSTLCKRVLAVFQAGNRQTRTIGKPVGCLLEQTQIVVAVGSVPVSMGGACSRRHLFPRLLHPAWWPSVTLGIDGVHTMDHFAVIQALLQWIKPACFRGYNAWNRGSHPAVSSLAPRMLAQAMHCAYGALGAVGK